MTMMKPEQISKHDHSNRGAARRWRKRVTVRLMRRTKRLLDDAPVKIGKHGYST